MLPAYLVTAMLCMVAPYATTTPQLAAAVFPYTSGPFGLVSVALGVDARGRRSPLWLEPTVLVLWAACAVAGSVYLAAPPLTFEQLFLAMRGQALFAGLGAIAVVLALWRRAGTSNVGARVVHAAALLAIGGLLARRCLMGVGIWPARHGLEAVSFELGVAQLVLVPAGAALLAVALLSRRRPAVP